ncbi:MAG: hypothetical protein KGJ98_04740 [Chloroflexota bacterium]|nr:hypothetical protein [Chloroflexota bacterium]
MTRVVAVGHVTHDLFPDGSRRLGGTALYAAAAAARLGLDTALVTRVGRRERDELARVCAQSGIDLRAHDAEVTTTFVFRWDEAGRRVLRLKARSRSLTRADVPPELLPADALVLGTVAHEIADDLIAAPPARISVLAAQGMLRSWDADGTVRASPWTGAEELIRALSCIVLSEDDVAVDPGLVERWSRLVPMALTLAERGARPYENGRPAAEVAAFRPAAVVDTTGAGDAFAAGLAVALAEGRPLAEACRFANAVASFGLEAAGTAGLAGRAAVERRLAG